MGWDVMGWDESVIAPSAPSYLLSISFILRCELLLRRNSHRKMLETELNTPVKNLSTRILAVQ